MSDICTSCRWPVGLHSGALDCPSGVPTDASADEMADWLVASRWGFLAERDDVTPNYSVRAWPTDPARYLAERVERNAPTLSAALRAVCTEIINGTT